MRTCVASSSVELTLEVPLLERVAGHLSVLNHKFPVITFLGFAYDHFQVVHGYLLLSDSFIMSVSFF